MSKKIVIKINNQEFDYNKLAEAIVKANLHAAELTESVKKDKEDELRQNILQQRSEYLKEKDFSNIKCSIWRFIRTIFNQVHVFLRILFISKKNLKLFSAIDSLISIFTIGLLFFIRIVLYLFSAVFLLSPLWGNEIFISIPIAFAIFVFAQLLRIAQNEVERINDSNYLLALFVGILTIFSIIISVIALFPDNDILQIKELLTEIKNVLTSK